jgi:GntR family transcriptional regulator
LWFDINQRSSTPIYRQLVEGIKQAIARGILMQGEKLPSVRELAARIAINPNTIAKAYQELERDGIIETLRGRGTFVAVQGIKAGKGERKKAVREMAEKILVEAYYLGLTQEELMEILGEAVEEWYRERSVGK